MESTIQIVLIICVVSLTAIFVTAGIWVVLILREFRKAAKKVSQIGDDVEETSQFVKEKIKDGFSMMALLATLSSLWSKREEITDFLPDLPEIKDKASGKKNEPEEENKNKDKKNEKKKKKKFFFRKKN